MSITNSTCRSSFLQMILCSLCLFFPVWSLVLILAFLSLLPNGAQVPGEPVIFFGMLSPFVGAILIFRMLMSGPGVKALLFIAYYVVCAIAMFVAGWAALGIFGLAK